MTQEKQRVSRHNGRAGKHGVYNPKHNDRQFDVLNAENIHSIQTKHNLYWDWMSGLRTHEENVSGQYPSFNEIERLFYEQQYGPYLEGQKERNIKAGHAKRNRTVDDLLSDTRICPEETIYQIGKEGDCPQPEVLTVIVQEFIETITKRFGTHVHILDWALHLDETSPHIHARQVFDVENRYGEIEPKQEKALEALGIPLPEPDKKSSKVNNRKITYDSICRGLLLDICKKHGLNIETEAIYGGKKNLQKNDYIIEKQREEIAALKKENNMLVADHERLSNQLEKKNAELDEKLDQLSNADTVLEAVADAAYDQAVKIITRKVVDETQKADQVVIDKMIAMTADPDRRIKRKDQELITEWFTGLKSNIINRAGKILDSILEILQKPAYHQAAKEEIKKQAKPSVRELLRIYASRTNREKTEKHQRSYQER